MTAAHGAPASRWLEAAEQELTGLTIEGQRSAWVYSTYVSDDTAQLSAAANTRLIEATVRLAREAARRPTVGLDPVSASVVIESGSRRALRWPRSSAGG